MSSFSVQSPSLKDETGEEGVVILPSDKKKKVLIGTRLASTKEKCSEHADKDGQDEAFEKHAEGLEVEGQTKELLGFSWPVFQNIWEIRDVICILYYYIYHFLQLFESASWRIFLFLVAFFWH